MGSSVSYNRCKTYEEFCNAYIDYKTSKIFPKLKFKDNQADVKLKFTIISGSIMIEGKLKKEIFNGMVALPENFVLDKRVGFEGYGDCSIDKYNHGALLKIMPDQILISIFEKERGPRSINTLLFAGYF